MKAEDFLILLEHLLRHGGGRPRHSEAGWSRILSVAREQERVLIRRAAGRLLVRDVGEGSEMRLRNCEGQ